MFNIIQFELPSPAVLISPPESSRSSNFESLRAHVIRSHKKSRPFDVIDEPPPRNTINVHKGIFTTSQHFYRNVYVRVEEQLPPPGVPLIPLWREVDLEQSENETESESETEDLTDEAYEKRHQKHEALERKTIKKDKSYQREQFYNQRLKVTFYNLQGAL